MNDWSIWTAEDLHQYFTGTYVGVIDDDGKHTSPCYIDQIAKIDGQQGLGFVGRLPNGNHLSIAFDSPRVQIILPESTYVNTGRECVYLTRITERQYKKGIRERQYHKYYISEGDHRACGVRYREQNRFSKEIVEELFNESFPSFDEAQEMISEGEVLSVAFHKHFCLANKPYLKKVVLVYKGMICGTVENNAVTFEEDLYDLQEKLIEVMEGA